MPEIDGPQKSPPISSYASDERVFSDVIQFFRRNAALIFGTAFAVGLVTAALLLLTVGKKYEASATLVIVPPRFSSELKPQILTVLSYQKILESDAVIAEAKKRLVERGVLAAASQLRLGRQLESRIFVSSRAEEMTLAPMLQAVARGQTGEHAAAIANTWAEVFLERTRELVVGTTSSTVKFIDEQYPQIRDSLAKLEDTRVIEANTLQKQFNEASTRWGDRITTFKGETGSLIATFRAETRRLVEEFISQRNMDSRKTQLAALRKAYGELQEEQARVTSLLQLKQLQLEAARKQLSETPPLLTLQKAITDDALWRSVADSRSGSADWKALQQRSLATQEVNPVFTSLSARMAEIEMDVNAMAPRAAALKTDLERINAEMKALESRVRMDDAELEKLTREREAGLQKLTEERENKLTQLSRSRDEELDGIKREMDTRLGQIDRNINQQRDLFNQLAKNYNQAVLAKGEQNVEDVRLGARAVAPEQPQPRGRAIKSLLAAILGGMLGIGVALVRESWGGRLRSP
jgi:uncharacterized protein involved in exopolysaccharide biosynthesis